MIFLSVTWKLGLMAGLLLTLPVSIGFAGEAEWAKKSVKVAQDLAKGNPQKAAARAVGSHKIALAHQTNVNANPRNVRLTQGVPQVWNKNVGATYQANLPLKPGKIPHVNHQANVSAKTPYFSTSTKINPKVKKK